MSFATFLRILLLGCLCSPAFLLIKLVVEEIPPFTAAALRGLGASLFLLIILKFQKKSLPRWGAVWKHFFMMGLITNAIPFCLFCYGEIYIDSSLAALINGSPPIFTAILAHYFLRDEPMTASKIVGILCGFGGLLVLLLPALSAGLHGSVGGILAIAAATFSYAVGFVYAKIKLKGLPPLIAPTSQLVMASCVLIPFALITEGPLKITAFSWTSAGSLLFLATLGTAIPYILFYRVLEDAGAIALSMFSYFLPVAGTLLGVIFLKEPLTWHAVAGGVLILGAMTLVNGLIKVPSRAV